MAATRSTSSSRAELRLAAREPRAHLPRPVAGEGGRSHAGFEPPVVYWMPSISVSGLTFYTGDKLPKWKGDLFVGGLRYGEIPGTGHLDRVLLNDKMRGAAPRVAAARFASAHPRREAGTGWPALRGHGRSTGRDPQDRTCAMTRAYRNVSRTLLFPAVLLVLALAAGAAEVPVPVDPPPFARIRRAHRPGSGGWRRSWRRAYRHSQGARARTHSHPRHCRYQCRGDHRRTLSSGHSPEEIEKTIGSLDWVDLFRDETGRELSPMRQKETDLGNLANVEIGVANGRLNFPNTMVRGQKIDLLLRSWFLGHGDMRSFDDLPITLSLRRHGHWSGEACGVQFG